MSDGKINPNSLIDKVLGYVDSPFKLFAILLMAIFVFVGYGVWQNQSFLISAYQENKKMPSINEDRVEDAANLLFKNTDAIFVGVFKVNPILGTRTLYRLYTKDKRHKDFDGIDVGLFTNNISNNNDVIRLMAGEIPCGLYKRAQSELGLWYISQGVNFTCRAPVPPDRTRFIGQITAGWDKEPKDVEAVQIMMEIAATMLTKKGA